MELIGLMGLKGAGKDTVGQYFVERHGYTTISFADSLKDCLSVIFGWDREMLEGRTPESRKWRESVDPWWAAKLGIEGFTPRLAMTNFGTDVMRKCFHDEIWVIATERKIHEIGDKIVISDVRFPNELAKVRGLGGSVFTVKRGLEPDWGPRALLAQKGDLSSIHFLKDIEVHESEWLLYGEKADATLHNDADLASLYQECEKLISSTV